MGEVVADGVGPIGVEHTGQLQEGATEVGRIRRVTIFGVDAVELLWKSGLQAPPSLKLNSLSVVATSRPPWSDYDISAVRGDGASESLGITAMASALAAKPAKCLRIIEEFP